MGRGGEHESGGGVEIGMCRGRRLGEKQEQQQQVGLLLKLVDYSCAFGIGFRFGSLPSWSSMLLADR